MTIKLFEQPHIEKVSRQLFSIERTGWVNRGVKNPETVGEHTEALIQLAALWAKDLGISDIEDLQNLVAFHDWPEIVTGDIVTAHIKESELENAITHKHEHGKAAMEHLCKDLESNGQNVLDYWQRFEEQNDFTAIIASELDKVQAVLKAFEYETLGEKVSTQEFIDYIRTRNQVSHPFLLHIIKDVESQLQ